ncbi:NAD(P)-dependent alcohol dehydrogenase [Thalassobaculum sp.]|uniref:zinc-dependent alcohol dehydrogenase family protein n=1 Tax=Thalassobaculum sp. TaxID=2022740 RepID=UPI0032EE9558
MKAWQITSDGIDALQLADREVAAPGAGEVRVRIEASAINYRDLMTVKHAAARGIPLPRIPNSDGAGTVTAVGAGVSTVSVGDRVASCFFQDWIDGACSPEAMASALGGALDGVLAEEVVLKASGVVPVPAHLSTLEAATLPCAALTAWNALVEVGRLKAGDTVLLLGTGGVSIFALQFATAMGARVILTSSSDEKLARAKAMGAAETVNYRATPEWQKAVLDLTGGRGVDVTVEVGGPGTLARSVDATRVAGRIALIGVLTGGTIDPTAIMRKSMTVQGVYVGSRRMFLEMNKALSVHAIKPVVDHTVPFAEAKAAYQAMEAAGHFGKIVIAG